MVSLLIALGITFLVPTRSFAWNASGHMQIALLAYDRLPVPVRQNLVELLRHHPRYETDFLQHLPPNLSTEADREKWIFAFAATWPDLARNTPEDHPSWHHSDKALEIIESQATNGSTKYEAVPRAVSSGADDETTIFGALKQNQRVFSDKGKTPEERALALSWILHLVGDAHQPLHAVSLYSKWFPKGDRGGNDIAVTDHGVLHSIWDSLLGKDTQFDAVENAVISLQNDPLSRTTPPSGKEDLNVGQWLQEDCELSHDVVYTSPILAKVQAFARNEHTPKPEVTLDQGYVDAATLVARKRAVQAGDRLAEILATSGL